MAGDPLGLVYTGQDNSGAAAILNNGTINPTQVLLDLQKEERLRKLREATVKAQLAAKAAKPENLGENPNFSPAPYHSAYFTQVASDLVKQRRPYDEGAIPQEQRPQFMQDYQIQKAGAMLLGVKSAKLWEDAKPQVEAYNKAPWRYPQGTNDVIKKWMAEPPDTQMPLQLQQLNESDYVNSIQQVDVGYPTRKVEVKNADGTSTVTDQNYFDEKNVRTKYDAWKSNKNDPNVLAFYDHAEELLAKAHPDYARVDTKQQAAWLDEIGYKFFREQKKAEFDQKYALGLQGEVAKTKNKNGGISLTGKGNVNVAISESGGRTVITPKHTNASPDTDFVIVADNKGVESKYVNPEIAIYKDNGKVVITGEKFVKTPKIDNYTQKPTGENSWQTTGKREPVVATPSALRDLTSQYGDVFSIDSNGDVVVDETNPNIKNVNDYRGEIPKSPAKTNFNLPKGVKL